MSSKTGDTRCTFDILLAQGDSEHAQNMVAYLHEQTGVTLVSTQTPKTLGASQWQLPGLGEVRVVQGVVPNHRLEWMERLLTQWTALNPTICVVFVTARLDATAGGAVMLQQGRCLAQGGDLLPRQGTMNLPPAVPKSREVGRFCMNNAARHERAWFQQMQTRAEDWATRLHLERDLPLGTTSASAPLKRRL